MSSKWSVTIKNNSGAVQTYVVFSEAPVVHPPVAPTDMRVDVMFALRGVAGQGGQAYFTLPSKTVLALCGTSDGQGRGDNVQFEVLDTQSVVLGTLDDQGRLIPGTTCEMEVDGTPRFVTQPTVPPLGELGAFCIKTHPDFTFADAAAGRYVVGLGVSARLVDEIGPYALFTPAPNVNYQIHPSTKIWIAPYLASSRDTVTEVMKGNACSIDFATLTRPHVLLVHNSRNQITQQVEAPDPATPVNLGRMARDISLPPALRMFQEVRPVQPEMQAASQTFDEVEERPSPKLYIVD